MKTLLLFCFLLPGIYAHGQNGIRFSVKEEIITVEPERHSFTKKVYHAGICEALVKNKVSVFFTELENLTDIKASYKAGNDWEKISKKTFTTSSLLTSAFYTGIQQTTIPFPEQTLPYSFQYSYEKENKDLIFLSLLDFMDAEYTDTFHYQIILPKSHELHYHIEDSLAHYLLVKVDKSDMQDKWIYQFSAKPGKEGPFPKAEWAWVRLIVTPKGVSPFDYLNDWYTGLVKPNSTLTESVKAEINNHVSNITTDRERIAAIFNLIKERTSYIAFENGIGAVMPRDVNKIWTAQQGDCKDMSNLLCQSLRAIGYDAQLALSATIGHSFDLNFPALSSANHVICVLKHEGEWLYLDATEREGAFGQPSRHIQGRKIFVINEDKGELLLVPTVKASDNNVVHQLNFEKKGNGLSGTIQYDYYGLSQIDWRDASKAVSSNRLEKHLADYLERQSSNLRYENVTLLLEDTSCQLNGKANSERNFTTIRQKNYLSLAFLPTPHTQRVAENATEANFYKTENQKFTVTIQFEEPVRLQAFENISFSEERISFEFSVNQTGSNQITIHYQYVNELLFLNNNSLKAFKKINTLIQETLRKTIIYEDPT